jgi:pyruvate formate lyase activating enzyme
MGLSAKSEHGGAPVSRREFLRRAGACGIGVCALGLMGGLPMGSLLAQNPPKTGTGFPEAQFYVRKEDGSVVCELCPSMCRLADSMTGKCRVRANDAGVLRTHAFNNPCSDTLGTDHPIEKGPLFHFLPGTACFAMATAGCNLVCSYCQNWEISQKRPEETKNVTMTSAQVVKKARERACGIVTFTYTDPVVFYEYASVVAKEAKAAKMRVHACTALYVNEEPLKKLCKVVDGWTIALKGFSEDFYAKVCGVKLKPVLDALLVLKQQKAWFEIVNLVVPGYNDDLDKCVRPMCEWIVENLGQGVPVHFARFVPNHKLKDLAQTPIKVMEAAWQTGQKCGLKYVYIDNLPGHDGNNTVCPSCKTVVIRRLGFKVMENSLKKGGVCAKCASKIPGVWG